MLSRAYSSTVPRPDERTHAIVEWWSDEEGWGTLTESDEMPGGAIVHFSAIQVEGYKSLRAGQVDARIEGRSHSTRTAIATAHRKSGR
jgi:cold shock CspA family protein